MQHFLKILDFSSKELDEIINLADQMKYESRHGILRRLLDGKKLGMIFQRPSTRTRTAFEVAVYELGGHAIYLPADMLQLSRGETIEDTARTFSRYLDGLVVRTDDQEDLEDYARFGIIPVINGLTEFSNPCQTIANLMTIREMKGRLDGLKVAIIGDGSATMNSMSIACLKLRMNVAVACPENYDPANEVLDYAAQVGHFEMYRDPRGAARAADVVVTDTWIPLGRENEYERRMSDFRGFMLTGDVMNYAKPDAIVLHGLPAQRGEEISADLFDQHTTEIYDTVENRLYVHKAILGMLMADESR